MKDCKEDPENNRHLSLKVRDHPVQDNQGIRPSQHGFVKSRSYLTDLISSYDKVSHLVDQGKLGDVIYLYFSKAFYIFFHSILLQKLAAHGLDRVSLIVVQKSGRMAGPGSGGEWCYIPLAASHYWGSPGLSFGASADLYQ